MYGNIRSHSNFTIIKSMKEKINVVWRRETKGLNGNGQERKRRWRCVSDELCSGMFECHECIVIMININVIKRLISGAIPCSLSCPDVGGSAEPKEHFSNGDPIHVVKTSMTHTFDDNGARSRIFLVLSRIF